MAPDVGASFSTIIMAADSFVNFSAALSIDTGASPCTGWDSLSHSVLPLLITHSSSAPMPPPYWTLDESVCSIVTREAPGLLKPQVCVILPFVIRLASQIPLDCHQYGDGHLFCSWDRGSWPSAYWPTMPQLYAQWPPWKPSDASLLLRSHSLTYIRARYLVPLMAPTTRPSWLQATAELVSPWTSGVIAIRSYGARTGSVADAPNLLPG